MTSQSEIRGKQLNLHAAEKKTWAYCSLMNLQNNQENEYLPFEMFDLIQI